MSKKYYELVSSLYVLNIIAQSVFSLLVPIGLAVLLSWILTANADAPGWIYAILVPLGAIIGIISMIKFAISASESLERLEKQRKNKKD